MRESLDELGREVAEQLGDGVDDRQRLRQRARLLEEVEPGPGLRRRWLAISATAAAGLAAIGLVAVWTLVRPASGPIPLECQVRGEGRLLAAGDWIEADQGQPVDLDFAEGSAITLAAGGRGRLAESNAQRVRVILESGRLRAAIRSRRPRGWTFEAGPYRVVVHGTNLAISWGSEQRALTVAVQSGRVKVYGQHIAPDGIGVAAGQVLSADLALGEVRLASDAVQPESPDLGIADATGEPLADASPDQNLDALTERVPSRPRKPGRPSMRWRALARSSDHLEAVSAAEQAGFGRLLRLLGADDLLLLADSARLAHRPQRARQALGIARKRFRGQHASRIAAFRLGRMAYDQGDAHAAVRWFSTFLREAGSSSLAADARGRLMLSLKRTGDLAAARRVAHSYLRLHPRGAYRAAAATLAEDSP